MEFEIRAIEPAVLDQLRKTDDAGREPRVIADEEGGAPLRCCLRRSAPGETIMLVSYAPLRRWAAETGADPGPYEELGPVFVHAEPCEGPEPGYPESMGGPHRVMRAYRPDGSILDGHLLDGGRSADASAASALLGELFDDPGVAVVHMRAVEFGCFMFEARRA
ncbi:DUF1203 domain-containing protein [Microbispora sp. ATCC PTA-5024]|uniref:DUF1203 domain-containing protein n=1 Tax=Microbispora sp. ATCC PTA-5024 TaxID=316330 RepID=UPI0003DCF9C1|nr:DUF1203 domain-containing protein [Microbispora sp. ATCC PTA-5024]ETK37927.1 hypothetical protein MPTA5024_01360 [Microbispora sp. ATCC PTA-5024]